MSRRRGRRRNSSAGSTLAGIFFLIILPIVTVKSCLFPDAKTPAVGSSYGSSYSTRVDVYPTSTYTPSTYDSLPTIDPTPDAEPANLPNANIPNPNLPGHGPHLHIPHVHLGGGHHHF